MQTASRILKATAAVLVLLASAVSCGGAGDEGLFNEGTGGGSGVGGTVASGGTGGSSLDAGSDTSGGAGGSSSDASPDVGGSDTAADGGSGGAGGSCTVVWCPDRDGDAHGDPGESATGCAPPAADWVTVCDDCHDGNPAVHPGAACSDASYEVAAGGVQSFDYDCNGVETECGEYAKGQTCGPSVLQCGGSGYLPNPERTASDQQDAYCGSTEWRQCTPLATFCTGQAQTKPGITCN